MPLFWDNDLFYPGQSGFRKLNSTLVCLIKNTDDWYGGLDAGKLVGLVFIDLKRLLKTVDHGILCRTLEYP